MHGPRSWLLSTCALLLLGGAPAWAEDRLPADRPGFADSTESVPMGRVAIETSVNLTAELEGAADPQIRLPDALIRVGLPLGLEARVLVPSAVFRPDAPGGASDVGATDLGVGAKLSLKNLGLFALSGVLTMTIPLESGDFGVDDDVTGTAGLNLDWSPIELLSFTLTGFTGWARSAPQLGIGGLTKLNAGPFQVYAQVFGTRQASSETFTVGELSGTLDTEEWSLGVGSGLAVMVSDTVQLDISADFFPYRNLDADFVTSDIPEAIATGEGPLRIQGAVGFSILL